MADPSDLELEVLKLFWRDGEMTVRRTQELAAPAFGWAASTTRTVLERMAAKGLLSRADAAGPTVYRPAVAKVAVLGGLIRKMAHEVLELAGPLPASAFTGSQILSPAELEELDAFLKAQTEETEQ